MYAASPKPRHPKQVRNEKHVEIKKRRRKTLKTFSVLLLFHLVFGRSLWLSTGSLSYLELNSSRNVWARWRFLCRRSFSRCTNVSWADTSNTSKMYLAPDSHQDLDRCMFIRTNTANTKHTPMVALPEYRCGFPFDLNRNHRTTIPHKI